MRILFLLLIALSTSHPSYSQEYKPLLDTYNEWNVRFCFSGTCETDVYYTNGDTLVDGMNFKILDGYHYISRGFLLREDVSQKKVFLKAILPQGTYDYLLYDFSIEVGDSIDMKNPITPFPEDAGYFKVDSIIPRQLVDGNNYDHFYFSPAESNTVSTNNAIWVEGVGSLSIITAPSGDPDINGVGRVACVFKNGESFYSDLSIIDECEPFFVLSTPEIVKPKNVVKVFSKSGSNIFEIINLKDSNSVELFNIKGAKLSSFKTENRDSMELNLKHYNPGMYLLLVESSYHAMQSIKIIVE